MIPKKIHYCWFGGNPLPEEVVNCINSWKRFCPDYEIIEWNENNYNLESCSYVKEAYMLKKWAFVSDYARLDIIYNEGGIYLDTDVELIKNLDDFLNDNCFLAMETTGYINTGIGFGAVKNSNIIKKMLEEYSDIHFDLGNGVIDNLPCPRRNTAPFYKDGFILNCNKIQYIDAATIYNSEYFCPIDYETGKLNITNNTVSIHHFNGSWISEDEKLFSAEMKKYKASHCKVKFFIYKQIKEYEMLRKSDKSMSILKFINKKFRSRMIQNNRKDNLKI